MIRIFNLALASCFICYVSYGTELHFPIDPQTSWMTKAPEYAGWDKDKLETLSAYADSTGSKAFILLQDGWLVKEDYYNGFTEDSVHYWASAGKTLTAFLVGIAIQHGKMNLDNPVSTYLGEGWSACEDSEEEKRTLRHHLTMTSGFNEYLNWDCTEPECLECIAEPGERWTYHQGAYTLVTDMIDNAYNSNINGLLRSNITRLTNIEALYVNVGNNRMVVSKPRDFAAFGLLLLAEGMWGTQEVLREREYFNEMISPSQNLNKSYGYLTWINSGESYMLPLDRTIHPGKLAPELPIGTFAGIGANGQIVCVIPEWNTVFIRMGDLPGVDYAPVDYFAELGRLLADARIGTSVASELEAERIPFSLNGTYAIAEAGTQMHLYDVTGRMLDRGERLELSAGVNFIECGGMIYKVMGSDATFR